MSDTRQCAGCGGDPDPIAHDPKHPLHRDVAHEMETAERKAWDSLARYKFMMFGYWAAVWVHLNRLAGSRKPNPFASLVRTARQISRVGSEPTPGTGVLVQTQMEI